jgi:prephenate dehydratase
LLAALEAPTSLPVGGFREVFEAVRDGAAEIGVVPIENVVNGTVREVYDLLLEHDLVIRGEVVVPVRLCLAALPGSRLEQVERVYSHIQALGQADRFLRSRPWALLTTYNTAGAGRLIAEGGEAGAAAVLSPRAAAHFGLSILADGIENDPANRTRFLLVARPDQPLPAGWQRPFEGPTAPRTTLAFAVRNQPGTLLAILQVLAERRLNLSTLESRPSRQVAWEYVFWADIDADLLTTNAASALDEIRPLTTMVRVLGAYERSAAG